MNPTDTKEKGFESVIVNYLVEHNGYEQGTSFDYNKEFAIDETRLLRFLNDTQADEVAMLHLEIESNKRKFFARLNKELADRGVIDVLRKGIKFYPASLIMFYLTPTENNPKAKELYEKNIFSVTRQLYYSNDRKKLALDICVFINGLPVITMELKNSLTKQCTDDAVVQYQNDRDPKDTLFSFKRCMVHFAVDDETIMFCTKLNGGKSWFLPFNKGYKNGAGNPVNPNGIKTDYLWKDILAKPMLTRIIEKYAQVIIDVDEETKKKSEKQIFPRYHQLDVVEKMIADVKESGVGQRYLIQHSAGSGKSNTITWTAFQLTELENNGHPLFESVFVVTDRKILDKQIRDNLKHFSQTDKFVCWAAHSSDLTKAIQDKKRLIVTTVEKFPYIVDALGNAHKDSNFAILIDEAHSGQNGKNSANMNLALSGLNSDDEMDNEDKVNALMEGRKLIKTVSYFAFTATPKSKTLEMFGKPIVDINGNYVLNEKGDKQFKPYHAYTMRQAIQEGFILDVLANYTPVSSYYKLTKKIEEDPEFDKKRAYKKLRKFVEENPKTVQKKAEIMVQHFHEYVIAKRKINGKARAMVVTESIARCVEYYFAINTLLEERQSPYKVIIAFSGEYKRNGIDVPLTSASLNGFPDSKIPSEFKKEPYRILIVADMFQTGFDEPLLHTMYVDKVLYDIKAVQTLSRPNRACEGKNDTFILDFANKAEDIQKAFSTYYQTTILSGETDPNKLYDIIAELEKHRVYTSEDVEEVVSLFLNGAERPELDPVIDSCVEVYKELDEDSQVSFKHNAKSFIRTYGFLGAILPFGDMEWEKLSIFLTLLIRKLPSPKEEDLSEGILDAVDLKSYRNEKHATISIILEDTDAKVDPVPVSKGGHIIQPEMEKVSVILSEFNDYFWKNADKFSFPEETYKRITELIPELVSKDKAYRNAMKNSDIQNAKIEITKVIQKCVMSLMNDDMQLVKAFLDTPEFKQYMIEMIFEKTYNPDIDTTEM